MKGRSIYQIIIIGRNAYLNLHGNDPLRLAGATAFFSFFSLPSLLIIARQVFRVLIPEPVAVSHDRLIGQLALLLGYQSASKLENISDNLQKVPLSPWLTVMGIVFVLVVSTTMLVVIKGSLNQLWNVTLKPTTKHSLISLLKDRLTALCIILFSILLISIYINVDAFLRTSSSMTGMELNLARGAHVVLVGLFLTLWVGTLFRFLPDAKLSLQALIIGAMATSVLLMLGGWGLEQILVKSHLGNIYGTSGSLIIVLLFVFYASFIFYFGATFSRTYALYRNLRFEPSRQAVSYQINEVEEKTPPPV